MNLREYLKSPFPPGRSSWRIIISVSLFIALFLLVFQPFGLQYIDMKHRLLILSGYGAVTFLALVFNLILIESVFKSTFSEVNRTVGKQILWILWILFTTGLGNYVYSIIIFPGMARSIHNLLIFQGFTLIVGIFPVTIITIITHNYLLKKNLQLASMINRTIAGEQTQLYPSEQDIEIRAEGGRDRIIIPVDSILFIESVGNYIEVHWSDTGKPRKKLLRNTLKNMHRQLSDFSFIFQCHRAYIVNLNKVDTIKGNAQGYRLELSGSDLPIPVSRNYIPSFNRVFTGLH